MEPEGQTTINCVEGWVRVRAVDGLVELDTADPTSLSGGDCMDVMEALQFAQQDAAMQRQFKRNEAMVAAQRAAQDEANQKGTK